MTGAPAIEAAQVSVPKIPTAYAALNMQYATGSDPPYTVELFLRDRVPPSPFGPFLPEDRSVPCDSDTPSPSGQTVESLGGLA
jgi:hypothetical protein